MSVCVFHVRLCLRPYASEIDELSRVQLQVAARQFLVSWNCTNVEVYSSHAKFQLRTVLLVASQQGEVSQRNALKPLSEVTQTACAVVECKVVCKCTIQYCNII